MPGMNMHGMNMHGAEMPARASEPDLNDVRYDAFLANDRTLARLIPGARLVLYPDAAHAFLFQDATQFAAVVESFLK